MTARRQRVEELLADHATTYMDQDGDVRCDCGKRLEPGEHEWPKHVAWMLDDAGVLREEKPTVIAGGGMPWGFREVGKP